MRKNLLVVDFCRRVGAARDYRRLVVGTLLTVALVSVSTAEQGDPALPGYHPLTQSQAGDVLISELRCAACHSGIQRGSLTEKAAPDLTGAGLRIQPDYLRRFLASPSSVHPGTTMPDVLASRPDAEKEKIAEALTHFLVAQSTPSPEKQGATETDRQQGKSLFHSVGCVACHGPKEAVADGSI